MDRRAGRHGSRGSRKFFAEVGAQLIAFAAHQFRLGAPQADGSTLRAHLEVAAQKGDAEAQLQLQQGPELPPAAELAWAWFLELDAARGSNGFSLNPITFAELEAWARLTGTPLPIYQVHWLRALDREALSSRTPAKKEA